jgi:hypothetical protein
MKYFLLLTIFLSGCSTWGVRESRVILPDGKEYKVFCQQDGQFEYKNADVMLRVDNRGRPGFLEQVVGSSVLGVSGLTNTIGNVTKDK